MQEFLKQTEAGPDAGPLTALVTRLHSSGGAGMDEATVLPNAATLGFLFCLWNSELGFSEGSKARTHRAS